MARKKKTETAPQPEAPKQPRHKCGECAKGKWIEKHSNKDFEGKYICLRCPLHKWARIRSQDACGEFVSRKK